MSAAAFSMPAVSSKRALCEQRARIVGSDGHDEIVRRRCKPARRRKRARTTLIVERPLRLADKQRKLHRASNRQRETARTGLHHACFFVFGWFYPCGGCFKRAFDRCRH